MLKSEAETLLRGCGLGQRVARTLLESGGNRDIYPTGRWVIRQISNHPTGKALGVYLAGDADADKRSNVIQFPRQNTATAHPPFVDVSALDDKRSELFSTSDNAPIHDDDLSSQPSDSTTKGDTPHNKQSSGPLEEGGPFVTHTHSAADQTDIIPEEEF